MTGLRIAADRRSYPIAALVLGLAWLVLGLSGPPVRAKEVDGIARLFFTRTKALQSDADRWGGTFDVRWNHRIGKPLSYQLSARYTTQTQQPLIFGEDQIGNSQLEPRIQIRWMPRLFEFNLGAKWLIQRTRQGDQTPTERHDNQIFGNFRTKWINRPELLAEFSRRKTDVLAGAASSTSNVLGQVSYTTGWWEAALGRRWTEQDSGTNFKRTTNENQFRGNVRRGFYEGRLSVFARYDLTDAETVEALSQASLVRVVRPVLRGLSALDPLPADGALTDEPALVDGNRSAATQVNIGGTLAGGEVGWNIGVELALNAPVDTLDIWLSDRIPAANALNIQWQVYTSMDNQNWTLVAPSPSVRFEEITAVYTLSFPSVTADFIKAVNITVDDALGAVFVSELEAAGNEFRQGSTERGTRTDNASARLNWNPRPEYGVSLTGFHNRIRTEGATQSFLNKSTSGNLSFSFRPSDFLVGTVSTLRTRRERTDLEEEVDTIHGFSLTAMPVPDLDLTVAASHRTRDRGVQSATIESYVFRAATLLYRDLSMSASYGESYEEDLGGPTRNRRTIGATLNTRPRREIEFNSFLVADRLDTVTGQPGTVRTDNLTWDNVLTVRPSSQFNFKLRGTHYDNPTGDGWSTVVNADWLPIAGGVLLLSLEYRKNDPFNAAARTISLARLRWNMNRDMFVDLEARKTTSQLPLVGTQAQTLLNVFFQARF